MICPYCKNDDKSMMEQLYKGKTETVYLCVVCSKRFVIKE